MKRSNHTGKMISAIILFLGVFLCSCQNSLENRSQTSPSSAFTSIPSKTVSPSSTVTNLPTNTLTPAITHTLTLTPELTIWPTATNTIKPHGLEQGTYIKFAQFDILQGWWYKTSEYDAVTKEWSINDPNGFLTYIRIIDNNSENTTFSVSRDPEKKSRCDFTLSKGGLILFRIYSSDTKSAAVELFSPSTNEFLEVKWIEAEQTIDIPLTLFLIDLIHNTVVLNTENAPYYHYLKQDSENSWYINTAQISDPRDKSYVLPNGEGYRWDEEFPSIQMECHEK